MTFTAVVVATLLSVIFLLTLLCFSLRDFSRSRLEEICKQHQKLGRFGRILRSHQRSLLISELALLTVVVASTWWAARSELFDGLLYPTENSWPVILAWSAQMSALVIFGGFVLIALPWTVARVRGELFLFRIWPLLWLVGRATDPVWQFVLQLDRLVHRVFGVPEPDSDTTANLLTEELFSVVDENLRQGVLESNASTMIHRVVDLQTEDVAAIMTPRTDMVTINAMTPLKQAILEMLENGFSRVPVIREGIDDIVGILYARDLLAYSSESTGQDDGRTAADIARDALYAPESQGIGDLLEAMRQRKVHMAIIVDEYSGVSGLVTLEDVLEEIVGEISDEYDSEDDTLWKEHKNGLTDVDARYHLDDLNEEFGYGFPEDEEFDTIGGFALSCFGRIPAVGEEQFWKDLKLVVLDADERHLIRVRIEGEASSPRPVPRRSVSP